MTRAEMIQFLEDECKGVTCTGCPFENEAHCDTAVMDDDELVRRVEIVSKDITVASGDPVNHPQHYELPGGLECFDVLLATQGVGPVQDFCLCNAMKYLFRHRRKNGFEDVKKAHWYLTKYIEMETKEREKDRDR